MNGYKDNGRQGTSRLAIGMRYHKEEKIFLIWEEGKEEDLRWNADGETDTQRMACVCNPAMNDINPDLTFIVDCADDLPEKRLPNLDFYLCS